MVVKVKLWDSTVGAVLWDESKQLGIFEFDRDFWEQNPKIAPITMPYAKGQRQTIFSYKGLNRETYFGLPGLLADSLPDKYGNRLIDAWLSMQGREAATFSPVERLSYIGKRGMGALEFEPALRKTEAIGETLHVSKLIELAALALQEKETLQTTLTESEQDAIQQIIRIGTSAGGARAKAIVAYNDTTKEIKSGQVAVGEGFEHWLLKFDGVTNKQLGDPQGYGRIEYTYYSMALAAGIDMKPSKLLEENGRAHFMTKRFDRIGATEKLHMQTLCGIAHFDYNQPGAYSYEQAFQVMRILRLPYPEAEELYRRMVFNVMARNQDDHTKNISFLMNKQNYWKLSPAYDVTFAFDPQNKWMHQHQLSINGKRQNIQLADLLTLAKEMNIKKPKDTILQVMKALQQWNDLATLAGIPADQIDYIGKQHLSFNL